MGGEVWRFKPEQEAGRRFGGGASRKRKGRLVGGVADPGVFVLDD